MTKTIHISSVQQFADLLKSTRLVVADFYADWCGPCLQIAPIFEQLSDRLSSQGRLAFAKIDTDRQSDVARAYQVTALPTFIVFREGNIVERVQGADPARLQNIIRTLTSEIGGGAGKDAGEGSSAAGAKKGESSAAGSSRGGGNEGGARWLGAELPRGYVDITEHVELRGCELLNADEAAGNVRVLFEPGKPSVLLNKGKAPGSNKDWVESDTDDQLLLFMPFHSMLKLHTLQITSLPPYSDDPDSAPMRPKTIKLFTNRPHNLGFDEADDLPATQQIELAESDWNSETGTASIGLRYVKFQNINSLVVFVVNGDGDGDKVRIDRIRLVGESGEKREMGKLEKIGDEPGE